MSPSMDTNNAKLYREVKRICIIGAGPSGLCSLRHCLDQAKSLSLKYDVIATVFEQQEDIGGVWNYSGPEVKLWDVKGNPMIFPMYSGLQCNLPKDLMQFQDFSMEKANSKETFPTQAEMKEYLVKYADQFCLWPHIKLNKKMVNVKPIVGEKDCRWEVTIEDTQSFQLNTETFDFIMSCVGVNYYPKYPQLKDIEKFQGHVFHSKYFKEVTPSFFGKNVILLGLGPSCADLCLKLSPVCKQVVACHKFPGGFSLGVVPPNVRETATVKHLNERSVTTENGEVVPCDILILCTGYRTIFPFLDENDFLDIGDENADNKSWSILDRLYKKIFVPKYPSFGFINGHGLVAEFLVMEIQARYFLSVLQERVQLPPVDVLEKCPAEFITQGKLSESLRKEKYALKDIEQYLVGLVEEAQISSDFRKIPLQLSVWRWVIKRVFGKLAIYRKDELRILSDTKWEYRCAPDTVDKKAKVGGFTKVFQLKDNGVVSIKTKKANSGL